MFGGTVGGRMAGTTRPRLRSSDEAFMANSSLPRTIGTIGEGWSGRKASTFSRRRLRSSSPSSERHTVMAAMAAAVSAALGAVVKMKVRDRFTRRSMIGAVAAT